jgi:precorrin-6B methylase 2
MSLDELMDLTTRMTAQTEALAVIAARLQLAEPGAGGDPAVIAQLDRIVDLLGVREQCDALDARERAIIVGFARAFLALASDIAEEPARSGGWTHTDPRILQGIGNGSAMIAPTLASAGLARPGMRILDVGAGVAALTIAFCRTVPDAQLVALEPWEASHELARANIAATGLDDRIDLRRELIEDYADNDGFDLVWLPGPFLPMRVMDDAIARAYELTRPGGVTVIGTFRVPEALAQALIDLRTLRAGGTPMEPDDAIARLTSAGFREVREIPRAWNGPLGLVVGTRA